MMTHGYLSSCFLILLRVVRFRSQAVQASYILHGSAIAYLYKDWAVDCQSNDDTQSSMALT